MRQHVRGPLFHTGSDHCFCCWQVECFSEIWIKPRRGKQHGSLLLCQRTRESPDAANPKILNTTRQNETLCVWNKNHKTQHSQQAKQYLYPTLLTRNRVMAKNIQAMVLHSPIPPPPWTTPTQPPTATHIVLYTPTHHPPPSAAQLPLQQRRHTWDGGGEQRSHFVVYRAFTTPAAHSPDTLYNWGQACRLCRVERRAPSQKQHRILCWTATICARPSWTWSA